MVHYRDDTGVYNANVEKVWKVVDAHNPETVTKIHKAYQSMRVVEQKDDVLVAEVKETGPRGPQTTQLRFVWDRPRGYTMEWLTGPMKGSKLSNTYEAIGSDKTRVIVDGDFKVEGMDDESTKKMVREYLDHQFDEDAAYLKTL